MRSWYVAPSSGLSNGQLFFRIISHSAETLISLFRKCIADFPNPTGLFRKAKGNFRVFSENSAAA